MCESIFPDHVFSRAAGAGRRGPALTAPALVAQPAQGAGTRCKAGRTYEEADRTSHESSQDIGLDNVHESVSIINKYGRE